MRVKKQLGITTTRQALNRKLEIKDTFKQTKERLKVKGQNFARSNSINIAHRRIESLANENDALRKANDALLKRFARWQYNALSRNMTMEQLDRELPQQDLGNLRNIRK